MNQNEKKDLLDLLMETLPFAWLYRPNFGRP
jgi:hypothetical protein